MTKAAVAQAKVRIPRRVKASTIAKHPSAARKKFANAPRIRKGIVPGAIGIILSGPYAGKRVVIVKALESGFIAITGPYEVNHVPLRRVHQKFLIATSTVLDISKYDSSKLVDALFKKQKDSEKDATAKSARSDAVKAEAKAVDSVVSAAVKAVPHMEQYLKTHFTLAQTGGLKAHQLKF
eukprot:Gregarina_sp_Poly_1__5284@NODE_279_length_10190_cov_93_504495_g243_i0_p9_GENE_NODE_279_length_10190_cov_93_504495_g243_i0NODE_279_length_10190_cov_93_504495_g243_i0_p9_ORF_typecomplete_len180_score31_89Ribosomal_L6e/PF01159_19/1_2e03Ribosomal_L6e/PF01159_19/5e23_NODE_279_length_10190_cov_93_504495_g243_i030563595